MGGVAYYLTAHHHGQLVLLPFGILTTTFLISYQRSKAESLGLAAKGGLMERAERLILLASASSPRRINTCALDHAGADGHDRRRPILASVAGGGTTGAFTDRQRCACANTVSACVEGLSRASRH